MNRHDMDARPGGEARLRYLDAEFQVVSPGTFVRCAVTGRPIPLAELRYWSVDEQEPYADAAAAYKAFMARRSSGGGAG